MRPSEILYLAISNDKVYEEEVKNTILKLQELSDIPELKEYVPVLIKAQENQLEQIPFRRNLMVALYKLLRVFKWIDLDDGTDEIELPDSCKEGA